MDYSEVMKGVSQSEMIWNDFYTKSEIANYYYFFLSLPSVFSCSRNEDINPRSKCCHIPSGSNLPACRHQPACRTGVNMKTQILIHNWPLWCCMVDAKAYHDFYFYFPTFSLSVASISEPRRRSTTHCWCISANTSSLHCFNYSLRRPDC